MINTQFEAYKIKRELKRSGIDYEFKRSGVNDFGEPVGEPIVVGTIRGLYHEQNGSVQVTTGDTTQVRTKKIPMILCLYEDAASLVLQVGDELKINNKILKVTGMVNIQEWNIIADISLEVVDNVV
jgi:hypothetical protein|nr:MAG TPA: hypothetical protein [Caudoviricetes sp.]